VLCYSPADRRLTQKASFSTALADSNLFLRIASIRFLGDMYGFAHCSHPLNLFKVVQRLKNVSY